MINQREVEYGDATIARTHNTKHQRLESHAHEGRAALRERETDA